MLITTTIDISPQLSCVTNVTPNHLDRFSWNSYVDLKRRIFEFQNKVLQLKDLNKETLEPVLNELIKSNETNIFVLLLLKI